jgi:hypothetical protein
MVFTCRMARTNAYHLNTTQSMKHSNEGHWICLQCAKFGRVTFGKETLTNIFEANEKTLLGQIKRFCLKSKVKMQADKTKSLFTFEIPRKKPIEGLVNWIH